MENIILELEGKKENVIKSIDKNFYFEIKEYLDFLTSNKRLKWLVKRILKKKRVDSREYEEISIKLKNKLIEIKNILEKENVEDKRLKEIFKEFDDYISGRIKSSNPLVENLSDLLYDSISLVENAKSISLQKEKEDIKSLFKEYYPIQEAYKAKEGVSEWFALMNLLLIKEAVEMDVAKLSTWEILNLGLLKNEIQKVSRGYETLNKSKKDEYINYLNKLHGFLIVELKKKRKIYFRPWWLILLLVAPIFISFILYNPFAEYDINQKLIKNLTATEPFNQYHFNLGSFNETEVEESLIVNYVEEWTRTTTKYKQYDLYFRDKSQISNPKDFQLKYNITIENSLPLVINYGKSKLIYEDIDLAKEYSLTMIPQITAIQRGDVLTVEFQSSYMFYIKKSWKEFILKSIPLFLFWVAGVFALTKVFEEIFGSKTKGE